MDYSKSLKDDQGIDFPVIATCLGFQSMAQILTNFTLPLEFIQNDNESLSLEISNDIFDH